MARSIRWVFTKVRHAIFYLRYFLINVFEPDVYVHRKVMIASGVVLKSTDEGRIIIGYQSNINHLVSIVAQGGTVEIGSFSFIGMFTLITAKNLVKIGSNVLIAERVTIRDQDHAIHGNVCIPINQSGFDVAPIFIGDDVWIAAGAVILKGVTIGRGAVVAANSVVNRDVREFEIVGGVPAKHIAFRKGHDQTA